MTLLSTFISEVSLKKPRRDASRLKNRKVIPMAPGSAPLLLFKHFDEVTSLPTTYNHYKNIFKHRKDRLGFSTKVTVPIKK
jgi:hypothetical protein